MRFTQTNLGHNFTCFQKSWCFSPRNWEIDADQFVIFIFQIWFHNFFSNLWSSIKYVSNIFRKANISNPLMRTRTGACQGVRNVSFSGNFAYVLNGWPLLMSWKFSACKMERFVIIVNGFQSLTIITKRSILDAAAVLDPPLRLLKIRQSNQ